MGVGWKRMWGMEWWTDPIVVRVLSAQMSGSKPRSPSSSIPSQTDRLWNQVRGELNVMVNKGVNGENKRGKKGDELELCQLGCWTRLLFLQKCPKVIASNGIVTSKTVGGKGIWVNGQEG